MIMKMYMIYDSKTECFAQPAFFPNKGTALRAVMEAAHDSQTNLAKYPGDFTVFEVGEFDDNRGVIDMYPAKINLGTVLEFQRISTAPHNPGIQSATINQ